MGDFLSGARSFDHIIFEDDKTETYALSTSALAVHQPWNIDYRISTSDGRIVWVNDVGAGIFDKDGKLEYLEGAITVIDAKKKAEIERELLIEAAIKASGEIFSSTRSIFALLGKLKNLSLNARIEAARNGAAGASFSVVAREMESLAKETSFLAADINQSIERMQLAFADAQWAEGARQTPNKGPAGSTGAAE